MGFVDRGGGREAKGTSLRRSKKNPGAPSTRNKNAPKCYTTPATRATPLPPTACLALLQALHDAEQQHQSDNSPPLLDVIVELAKQHPSLLVSDAVVGIDAAVALLARRLEADQEGIRRRAVDEGRLSAVLCWCNEVERQPLLLETCVEHNKLHRAATTAPPLSDNGSPQPKRVHFRDPVVPIGGGGVTSSSPLLLYSLLGIHVNSIDRVNLRLHDQWITDLEASVKHGDVLGVLTGLNFSRDSGTHYAQERLMKECWRVAAAVQMPLVVHLESADEVSLESTANRAAEILQELLAGGADSPTAVVLYRGLAPLACSPALQQLVRQRRPQLHSRCDGPHPSPAFYVLLTAEALEQCDAITEAAILPPPVHCPRQTPVAAEGKEALLLLSQLLIGTGSPAGTPQTIPDEHLRTLPNEPGNLPYTIQAIYAAMQQQQQPSPAENEAAVVLTQRDIAGLVLLNFLRVFFASSMTPQQQQASSPAMQPEPVSMADVPAEDRQQADAPATVAGLTDEAARRDLEQLLAEAARERERVAHELAAEEEAMAAQRSENALERRQRREKKKNVKANNRSNFTHFRNKNFAPRGGRPDGAESEEGGEAEGLLDGSSSDEGSSDGEQRDAKPSRQKGCSALQRQQQELKLLAEGRHHHETSSDDERSARGGGKRRKAGKKAKGKRCESDEDEPVVPAVTEEEVADDGPTVSSTITSRRQRKRKQRRQQQQRSGGSGDEDAEGRESDDD